MMRPARMSGSWEKAIRRRSSGSSGNADGDSQIILAGLKAGDRIVTDGTHKVIEGMEIEPDKRER